ncbi:hypothetical protein AMATHDRAFT_74306 [Amanita thiersii Skay4041]|uniref:TatD DNase family Scn1 n=1 Tax=Amanita thiersii Skay4041 TaxID=703135 RepID=A0A2A9NWY6_9AGAR|nr:hypothetical protein AMATHDRAFT_74306 [Amanita thiersii Skay4041]
MSSQVVEHVTDVHCHPTDAPVISVEAMQSLQITICAMATRPSDQTRVRDLAIRYPSKVIPSFGYHPWFSHYISLLDSSVSKESHYRSLFLSNQSENQVLFNHLLQHLPDPIPLEQIISELRNNLIAFPNAMLGEVGLDRVFRIPVDYFASPRKLTPFTIPLKHQLAVIEAQLRLAVEMGRNVSFHSVKSQQATITLLADMRKKYGERWDAINVDIHSCTMSSETWRAIEKAHPNVFMSVSTVINGRNRNLQSLIAACSPNRIMVESDYNNVEMTTPNTWEILLLVANVKGWHIEQEWLQQLPLNEWGAVRRLEANWIKFGRGVHVAKRQTETPPTNRDIL